MDLISALSLIFDIPWLSDWLFGIKFDGNEVNLLKYKYLYKRAGRVSRVTTRAARLVRFIRLIRLMRIGKLYKHAFEAINDKMQDYYEDQFMDE